MIKEKKYDDETLKHQQQVSMKILKYLIEICEKHNLTYFMYGGTLIGAVRHQGYVPWDDDIDVIMFREDFEKLNQILEKNIDDKYRFMNCLNEETYYHTWGRVMLKNTLFREWWADQVDYTPNIYIDIFILDNIPNNKFKQFIHRWKCYFLNMLSFYSSIKYENDSKIKQIIQRTVHYTIKILHISPYTIRKKCIKSFTQYQNEDCEEVCDFPSSGIMPISFKTDWFPLKKVKFEDIKVNIPNNYDKILKMEYGEYMELPPEESRFRPAPEEIDFGEY